MFETTFECIGAHPILSLMLPQVTEKHHKQTSTFASANNETHLFQGADLSSSSSLQLDTATHLRSVTMQLNFEDVSEVTVSRPQPSHPDPLGQGCSEGKDLIYT